MPADGRRRVVIRVDGDNGREAGLGHVYRSLAIANYLRQRMTEVVVTFLMRNLPEGVNPVVSAGYPVWRLPERAAVSDLERALAAASPELLVIDTLGSSESFISLGRRCAKVIVTLDDLEPSAAEADIVINGIVWATSHLPEHMGRARVYQGVEFISLREEFADYWRVPRQIGEQVRRMVISTGGADYTGSVTRMMEAVARAGIDGVVDVIVGSAHSDPMSVVTAAAGFDRPRFVVSWDVSDMARRVFEADLALITGGTVLFECAACGTPAIVACSYEHQLPAARWFHERRAAVNVGSLADPLRVEAIAEAVSRLAKDRAGRLEMHENGRRLVDGQGLRRVTSILLEELESAA